MDEPIIARTRRTPEERARYYEQQRKVAEKSIIYARHRDPNMYVKWVRDDNASIPIHKAQGFQFANDNPKTPEPRRTIDTVVEVDKDGMYRLGDVILMQIDRDAYEFKCSENDRRSREALNAPKKVFREEAERQNIPTFERDKSGKLV